MRKTNVAQLVVGLALLAAPAFASSIDTPNFHALSDVVADVSAPAMLSDEQLATVEGGNHLTTGVASILHGYILANQQPFVTFSDQALLRALATADVGAGAFIVNSVPVHFCGGAAGIAC